MAYTYYIDEPEPWNMARAYAHMGIPVFPLHYPIQHGNRLFCSCGSTACNAAAKHPLTLHGLKDASTDAVALRWWQKQWPKANIGIVTGAQSGLVVLDIDPRHGGDATLDKLERQYGKIPTTWRFKTGGGGEHILFAHPGGVVPNSASKIGQGIDLRGDGGYIVAPPSQHISGRYYIAPDELFDTVPLADMPVWLLDLVKKPESRRVAIPTENWIELVKKGAGEGHRHNSLISLAGKLLSSRLDPYLAFELCLAWNDARCKPPLLHEEVCKAFDGIAGLQLKQLKGKQS